jgi:cytoskeleton protein RodZ
VPAKVTPAPAKVAPAPAKVTPAPVPEISLAVAERALDQSADTKTVGAHRIVFRFEQEAWIEVTDGGGRLLASSLNAAGSERVLQGKPPFNLVIGNASHVHVNYKDRDVDLQPHVRVEVARFTLE